MSEEPQVGFVTMAQAAAEGEIPSIGIGMLGYAFMGKAHTNALKKIAYITYPPPFFPRLVSISGRNEEAVKEAAKRYGYERHSTNWRDLVEDPDVQVFDNGGPNDTHAEPTIAAARAGKHVICEKPLGRTAEESYDIWKAVAETGVKHMTAFNYRFYPAIRLAKEMIDAGELGEIYHFRGRYHQEWIMDPQFPKVWRLDKEMAGSGALGDLGAHVIDQSRYLVGEPTAVSGLLRTFIEERPGGTVDVDDAFEATVEFENGAIGTYEATRYALGRKNQLRWEINGSKGTIVFDAERQNELEVNLADSKPGERTMVAEIWRTRDYALYSDWYTMEPDTYYATQTLPPSADDNPERRQLVDNSRALVAKVKTDLADSGVTIGIPAMFWRDGHGQMMTYIGYAPEGFPSVRANLLGQ